MWINVSTEAKTHTSCILSKSHEVRPYVEYMYPTLRSTYMYYINLLPRLATDQYSGAKGHKMTNRLDLLSVPYFSYSDCANPGRPPPALKHGVFQVEFTVCVQEIDRNIIDLTVQGFRYK